MRYLLLTGVTGLLGRYLLKDLLLAGVKVAVLARPTRKAKARLRVEEGMCYWEQQLGRELPRPVVLEGDICEPDLGLDPRSMRWVAEHCDTMLHNAASLSFVSTGPTSEPWRSNLEGTKNVLDLCRNAGIRRFHHVSTAYTCGLRTGKILETELDEGQEFSNDYERSKVQAEKLVRSADFLDSLTVHRPAIIIGDSKTGYTSTYHGFYAPLQVVQTMVQRSEPNATGHVSASSRFPLSGDETKNLIPVDWVSAVMSHIITHPEHHGKTYNLTPRQPVNVRLMADVLEETARFYAVSLEGSDHTFENPTEDEKLFNTMIAVYHSYWRDDPVFDTTNTRQAAPHLPCPHVDRTMLRMLADFAVNANFDGPKARPAPPEFDAHQILDPLVEAVDQLPRTPDATPRLGLQVTGHGGGQWHLLMQDGQVVAADLGLDAQCTATFHLDVTTFASLSRGELTAAEAVDTGRLEVIGNGLPHDSLLNILDEVAKDPSMQPQ